MSVLISNTDYSNIPAFADEVRSAFKSAVPPVCIAIDTKENVELFTQMFPSERGYLGKRVACKHAMIGSFNNFSINEIFSFGEERFPIQLSFKQISELEDFAKGWQRAIEKAATPVVEPSTTAPVEETKKNAEKAERAEEERVKDNQQNTVTQKAKAEELPKQYPVNPFAESILDTLLKINLVFGWILAIGGFIAVCVFAIL